MIMFLPVGVFLPLAHRRLRRFRTVTLVLTGLSVGIELIQFATQRGYLQTDDEIIMDYSIHDAIEAGFNKIIFIIRKDIESDFKERIGDRVENLCERLGVEVAYCFQDMSNVPGEVPAGRTKPWGTGQAVLAAKTLIHESFVVINADDYYGKEAFRQLHDWLILEHDNNEIAMAGFILAGC